MPIARLAAGVAWLLTLFACGAFGMDDLITNATIGSAMRSYQENARAMYASPAAGRRGAHAPRRAALGPGTPLWRS